MLIIYNVVIFLVTCNFIMKSDFVLTISYSKNGYGGEAYNFCTWKVEAGGLQDQCHPQVCSKTLSYPPPKYYIKLYT